MENYEKDLNRLREQSILKCFYYIQRENPTADHFLQEGPESTPFIKTIRDELGKNTPTSLQCSAVPVLCGLKW